MSALGQKQIFASQKVMSALPQKPAFHSRSRMPAKGHKRTLCSAIVMYFFTLMAAKFGSQSGPVWRAHTLPHFPMTGIFKKVPIMHRYDLPLALAAAWLSEL
jgi:hypothetical protein